MKKKISSSRFGTEVLLIECAVCNTPSILVHILALKNKGRVLLTGERTSAFALCVEFIRVPAKYERVMNIFARAFVT